MLKTIENVTFTDEQLEAMYIVVSEFFSSVDMAYDEGKQTLSFLVFPQKPELKRFNFLSLWGLSSIGRASVLHTEGQEFDSPSFHK